MIKAIVFDLDGTLVQTEILKAHSYASALSSLSGNSVSEEEVVQNFKNYVGLSRADVAKNMVQDYWEQLKHISNQKVETVNLLIEKRLENYNRMLETPNVLQKYFCKNTIGFLKEVKQDNFLTGLATMSNRIQVKNVLQIMGIQDHFNFVITRDEITNSKPHPEIYLQMKNKLKVEADECVVIEDSVTGVKAALSAKMNVFVVTNSITKESVRKSKLLDKKFIIEDPAELRTRVYEFIENPK
ncbi:MAG: HAD family phosphatase [Ignavibacteria bacterium]|nr:HAD family phosphatase [Ignavibacteria bacterium]